MQKITKIILITLIIPLVFFTSFGTLYAFGSIGKLAPDSVPLTFRMGMSYPPLKTNQQRKLTNYHCEKFGINLVRTGVSWSYSEPTQGTFTWSGFDKRMNFFRDNGYDILLTIASDGPDWVNDLSTPESSTFKNTTAFEVYLRALFTRYKNYNIHKVQFGNEWPNSYQFIGTAEQYTNYSNTVYNIIQEITPTTTFVLGGIAVSNLRMAAAYYNYTETYRPGTNSTIYSGTELQEILASEVVKTAVERVSYVLANASYDELDLHLYDDYENWGAYVTMVKDLIPGKPIIVSEFGGPNVFWEKYSNKKQAQHLNNSILALNDLDIDEAYYFKMVQSSTSTPQHRKSSLFTSLLGIKPSYYVMQIFTTGYFTTDFGYYAIYSLIPTALFGTLILITAIILIIKKKRNSFTNN